MQDHARGPAAALWAGRDAQSLALIVDDILRDEAWWIAVKTGKYAQAATVWVDRPNTSPVPDEEWPRPEPWGGAVLEGLD